MLADGTDADVIAFAEDPLEIAVQVFHVRGGRVRGQRGWVVDRVDDADHRRAGRALPPPAVRRRGAATPCPARCSSRRCPEDAGRLERVARPSCAAAGSSLRVPAARRQERACWRRSSRNAAAVPGAAQDQARPATSPPAARRSRSSRRRWGCRGAAADRVLRHLQPPGHRGGGVDGGLRGRPAAQERVPPLRRSAASTGQNDVAAMHEVDHPPVPAAARRAGRHRRLAGATGRARATGPLLIDPDTGRPTQFAYAARPGRRRRRPAAGRRRPAGARRARHRRHRGVRPGQAPGGGLAARRRTTR